MVIAPVNIQIRELNLHVAHAELEWKNNMPYTIDEIREKAVPIAKRYDVDSLCLFGSYARGEADEHSDIDFYVDKTSMWTIFERSGMILDLEDVFGCHVDVIVLSGIKNMEFYREITSDGIKLYEKK